ncbi:MAG TPA: hypothetical protein VG222_19560 [Vicinamibacterales bacterium]|jgi:hypothetical protein|nr:hypothetical protein [Vicinamibacterales bacterium]
MTGKGAVPLFRRFIVLCALLPLAGCRSRDAGRRLDGEAERYVRIVLALGDRDPDSLDFYAGPPAWKADAHARNETFHDIKQSATALIEQLEHDPTTSDVAAARREFLRRQLRAVAARIDVLDGRRFTFDDESRALFGVEIGSIDHAAIDRARALVDRLLPGSDSLALRYARFDRQFMIPPKRLAAVMTRALDGCRHATLPHMPLPSGEHVTIEYVSGTPWSAFTRYEGRAHSRIQINAGFGLTVDRALQLACHEGYPGHHAINTWIDTTLIGPQHRIELTVQPMFSPQSLRTEGAATFAPELAFSDAERLQFERDELFPIAGLDGRGADEYLRVGRAVDGLRMVQAGIAREYLDGNLEFARASVALEREALMPSADATLKFFNQFRSYAVAYTLGHDLVARAVEAQSSADRRWQAYERWVTGTK